MKGTLWMLVGLWAICYGGYLLVKGGRTRIAFYDILIGIGITAVSYWMRRLYDQDS